MSRDRDNFDDKQAGKTSAIGVFGSRQAEPVSNLRTPDVVRTDPTQSFLNNVTLETIQNSKDYSLLAMYFLFLNLPAVLSQKIALLAQFNTNQYPSFQSEKVSTALNAICDFADGFRLVAIGSRTFMSERYQRFLDTNKEFKLANEKVCSAILTKMTSGLHITEASGPVTDFMHQDENHSQEIVLKRIKEASLSTIACGILGPVLIRALGEQGNVWKAFRECFRACAEIEGEAFRFRGRVNDIQVPPEMAANKFSTDAPRDKGMKEMIRGLQNLEKACGILNSLAKTHSISRTDNEFLNSFLAETLEGTIAAALSERIGQLAHVVAAPGYPFK